MKRLTAVMVLVCMFSLFVMPVGAAEVEGTASYDIYFARRGSEPYYHDIVGDVSFPRVADGTVLYNSQYTTTSYDTWMLDVLSCPPSVGLNVSGVVAVYLSLLYQASSDIINYDGGLNYISNSDFLTSVNDSLVVDFYDVNGSRISADIKSFTQTNFDGLSRQKVYNFSGRTTSNLAVTGFYISPSSTCTIGTQYTVAGNSKISMPSLTVVATQSSMELDALENMAAQITQQNRILEAMQGDIIALLQQISNKVSTEETLRLATQYLLEISAYSQQISSDLQSVYTLLSTYLHYLQQIAETADDIYAELQAFHDDFILKLDLLISTIMTESDDIQATMDRIYQQLIAYLDATYTEAINPEFEDSRLELDQGIEDNHAIEQQWTGSLSDAWTAMNIQSYSFDAGITSGFMWVSSWFSNIYNAAGIYGAVLILPLLVGICKLLLGMFRFAGHGSREEDDGA